MALLHQFWVCHSALDKHLNVNIDNRKTLGRSSSVIVIFWLQLSELLIKKKSAMLKSHASTQTIQWVCDWSLYAEDGNTPWPAASTWAIVNAVETSRWCQGDLSLMERTACCCKIYGLCKESTVPTTLESWRGDRFRNTPSPTSCLVLKRSHFSRAVGFSLSF